MDRSRSAIRMVLAAAVLWGFWWYPVRLLEEAGLRGPWIGVATGLAILPAALIWLVAAPRRAHWLALTGGLFVGLAVTLYALAASYTDFIRAVLLFYLAPTWSTLIELVFLGRRWRAQTLGAIVLSLAGVMLITGGVLGIADLGAVGDWMALASGLCWSAGMAMIFATCRSAPSLPFLFTAIGAVAGALVIAAVDGSLAAPPDPLSLIWGAPYAAAFVTVYIGVLLASAVWGGIVLPPAVVTYLLSVEVLAGAASSALILEEPFGIREIGGTVCILAAVLIEVVWTRHTAKPGDGPH